MARSMTGYGRGEDEKKGYRFIVEMRSVNHRSIDVQVKMPRELWPLEVKIREVMQEEISRGRVEIYVNMVSAPEDAVSIKVDHSLAKAYYNALLELERCFALPSDKIGALELARFPELLLQDRDAVNLDTAWQPLHNALQEALSQLVGFREKEGRRLAEDFVPRLQEVRLLAHKVEERNPRVVESYREKLVKRLEDILPEGGLDVQRLYQEVAFFAEKSNITEEVVRLKSHLDTFAEVMEMGGPVGRRMDFILQEMLREVNTVASKSSDTGMAKMSVEIKSELEKIREQIQNLE